MGQRAFLLIVGIVFLLFALGHLTRVIFGMSFVVQEVAVPMWASVVAIVIAAFLSYEGFHFSRKAPPKV